MSESFDEGILKKIKSGEVKMHKKSYFVLQSVLLALALMLAFFIGWFTIGFIIFIFDRTGAFNLAFFGIGGFMALFQSFPWIILVFGLVFAVIFEIIFRKFFIGYKTPIIFTVILAALGILSGSLILEATGLNYKLHDYLRMKNLPALGSIYQSQEASFRERVILGQVATITPDGFMLTTPFGEQIKVNVDKLTQFPLGKDLKEGERVFIGGVKRLKDTGEEIEAIGVRKLEGVTNRSEDKVQEPGIEQNLENNNEIKDSQQENGQGSGELQNPQQKDGSVKGLKTPSDGEREGD